MEKLIDISNNIESIKENILRAEEEIKKGKVRDAEAVFDEWKLKFGV